MYDRRLGFRLEAECRKNDHSRRRNVRPVKPRTRSASRSCCRDVRVFFECCGFFSNGPAAENAINEAFLHAYQNIRGYNGGDFASCPMRISGDVYTDAWRRSAWNEKS